MLVMAMKMEGDRAVGATVVKSSDLESG